MAFDNVFAADDKISVVFDFETAECTVRLLDLARTYLSMRKCTTHTPETILEALVRGYDSEAKTALSAQELEALPLAIKYAAGACAVWAANYDTEESSRAYIALGT